MQQHQKISVALLLTFVLVIIQLVNASQNLTNTNQFIIPTYNSTINFSNNGSYESAKFENNTWFFTGLLLNGSNLLFTDADILSKSYTHGNLSIFASDCNVTITNFDLLLTPEPDDPHQYCMAKPWLAELHSLWHG